MESLKKTEETIVEEENRIQAKRTQQFNALNDVSFNISMLKQNLSETYHRKTKQCMGYNSLVEFDTCLQSLMNSHNILTKEFVHRTSFILNKHLRCVDQGYSRSDCSRITKSALHYLESKLDSHANMF